jgi:hypothetical protein
MAAEGRAKQFSMSFPGVPRKKSRTIPLIAELKMDDGHESPQPSVATAACFANQCDLWVAVDIETHMLVPASKGRFWITGQYGHSCRVDDAAMADLRVVQLGWCVGRFSSAAPPQVTQFLVRPSGFEVETAATAKHRITTERAENEGVPLRKALATMLEDVFAVVQQGGRLCAHQLEFDCGVIALELQRAGLEDSMPAWCQVATEGFCTINPAVTRWSCSRLFDEVGADSFLGRRRPVGLNDMVRCLLPNAKSLLEQHHDAGWDAQMAWLVLRELHTRMAAAAAAT